MLPILQHQYHDFLTSCLKEVALVSLDNICFGFPYFSQESVVPFQLPVLSGAFPHSLTKLQD